MKIKTNELIGPALDWAVAKCEGYNPGVITVEEMVQEQLEAERQHANRADVLEYLNTVFRAACTPKLCNVDPDGFKAVYVVHYGGRSWPLAFSTDWAQGGPILDRELIDVYTQYPCSGPVVWYGRHKGRIKGVGPTALIAAMRCFVSYKLGDAVEVPEELL